VILQVYKVAPCAKHDVDDNAMRIISIKLTTAPQLLAFSLPSTSFSKKQAQSHLLQSKSNYEHTNHNVGHQPATTRPHRQSLAIRQGSRRGKPCPSSPPLFLHPSQSLTSNKHLQGVIGNVTGNAAWQQSGVSDKQGGIDAMKAASQNRDPATDGYGKVEEMAGKLSGCEGMEKEGAMSAKKD
jgi:uncharacterized protein YjbJ (UPF0337 family)